MDTFKEIRSLYEVELKSATEFEYEYEKLLNIHREFQAKNILLDVLEAEFLKLGRDKFIEISVLAISKDSSLCSPNFLFNNEDVSEIEKMYYKELAEFNRQFLSKNLMKLQNIDLIKFLTESLLINNISRQFLESFKTTEQSNSKSTFWNFLSVIKKTE